LDIGLVELKDDPVALFNHPAVQCIGFPKPAFAITFIMAVLAISVRPGKYPLDMIGTIFQKCPVPIQVIQVQPEYNIWLADVDAGVNNLAPDPRPGINQHVFAPTITIPDFPSEIVTELVQLVVKCQDKFSVIFLDKIKSRFFQNIGDHDWLLVTLLSYHTQIIQMQMLITT
jgi:hypothetical protein